MDSLEYLRQEHNDYLQTVDGSYSRQSRWKDLDWSEKLLFIKGARGVGKSTMILQYIKNRFDHGTEALYITIDSLNISRMSLVDIARKHQNLGGTHLYIDEIHKYEGWSKELKNINDLYKKLHVVVVGSSILQMYQGEADLSRRAVTYNMEGLSFREFIEFQTGEKLEPFALEDVLKNHLEISMEISNKINPLILFKDYIQFGYYPFYLQGTKSFRQKLNNAINQSIEQDIVQNKEMEVTNINKVKKLLYTLAINVPFKPNSTKLAESMELNRQTLNLYLNYLNEARIINSIYSSGKAHSLISKPEKIYLDNSNLCYLVPESRINIGNLRETFFANQVSKRYTINTSDKGDFLVDNKYFFEVGGSSKKFKQIANIPNSFVAIDEELIGYNNKIPLWLFGLLY